MCKKKNPFSIWHPEPGPFGNTKKNRTPMMNFNVLWRSKKTTTNLRWTSNFWNNGVTILWFRGRYVRTFYRIPETKLNKASLSFGKTSAGIVFLGEIGNLKYEKVKRIPIQRKFVFYFVLN